MYIVLPLLETLTSAPIHTLHTHFGVHTHPHTYLDMHSRHEVCDHGVFVHMCVYVCLCMSVKCVYLTQTDSGDTPMCVAFTKTLLFQ